MLGTLGDERMDSRFHGNDGKRGCGMLGTLGDERMDSRFHGNDGKRGCGMLGTLGGERMDSRFRGNDDWRNMAYWVSGWQPCPGTYFVAVRVMNLRSFPPDKGGKGGCLFGGARRCGLDAPSCCHARPPSVIPAGTGTGMSPLL